MKEKRVSMPVSLTAENGSKHAMIGEFYEDVAVGEDDEIMRVPISWTTIKSIYRRAVELHGEDLK